MSTSHPTSTGIDPSRVGDLLDSPQAGGTVIRGSAMRAAAYAVAIVLSLASAPLLTRYLGIVDFGRYMQVVSLVALVGAATEAGLSALGMREYAVIGTEARRNLARNLLGLRLVLTVLGIAVAAAFAAAAGYGATLVLGTIVAGVGLLTYVTQGTYAVALAAELRIGWVAIADVVRQVVLVALFVALVLAGASLVLVFAVPIAAGAVALLLTAWLARRSVPLTPGIDLRAWRTILRETLPLAASGAIYTAYFRLVILMMPLLASAWQVGYFALAFRVTEALMVVPFVLLSTLLPVMSRAARDDHVRLRYALQRTFEVAAIAGVGMTLVAAVGAPLAIALLSDHGGPAVGVLQLQSLTLAIGFLSITGGLALVTLRRARDLVVANALALGVTVVATVALVPLLGAHGGALATIAGELCLMIAYGVLLLRSHRHLQPSLSVVPRVLLAAALAVLAVVLCGLEPLLQLVIAVTVYVAALVGLRAIPRELVQALLAGLPRRAAAEPTP